MWARALLGRAPLRDGQNRGWQRTSPAKVAFSKKAISKISKNRDLKESSGERFNEVQGVVSITALTDDLPKKVARRMEDAVYPEDCEERAAAPRVVGRAGDELGCWARCALIEY